MKELVRWILLWTGLPWVTVGWLWTFTKLASEQFTWREVIFLTYLTHYGCFALALLIYWAFTP